MFGLAILMVTLFLIGYLLLPRYREEMPEDNRDDIDVLLAATRKGDLKWRAGSTESNWLLFETDLVPDAKIAVLKTSEKVWNPDQDGFEEIFCYRLILEDRRGQCSALVCHYNPGDPNNSGDQRVKELFDLAQEKSQSRT